MPFIPDFLAPKTASTDRAALDKAVKDTGHLGVPGEGVHPDFEGIDICMKCTGHTQWPCKVINDYIDSRTRGN